MKLRLTPPLQPGFWHQDAGPAGECPPLTGQHHADIAIVGGGFVGLWTALTIKQAQPDCKVVVLEQHSCGAGASGRNGGFVMSWWPKIASLLAFSSPEQALFLAQSSERAIAELGEFCNRHAIDAHFTQKGWLWTATTAAHMDSWKGTLQACADLGAAPFREVSGAEVRHRTGSPIHLGGVFEASNATVQPALLIHGLRRVALEAGVIIHEHSGVTEILPGPQVRLQTSRGVLRAARVVLATNAWSAAIPELRRVITPVNSSIVVTRPLPQMLKDIGWVGNEAITDSQVMVDYYRTTRDGQIVFGKGTGALSFHSRINAAFSNDEAGLRLAIADLLRTYPSLPRDALEQGWSGPIDRTYDSLPVFGALTDAPNIFYGIGWSGNGVGPSRLGGRILASLALGRQDEWSRSALVHRPCRAFPPEPLRYLGGQMVRRAVLRKDADDIAGTRSAALTRILAGLAPAGLEDKQDKRT